MADTPIAVTGATGAVGGHVAQRLADLGVPTRLVVRDPDRAPHHPDAEVVAITGYGHPGSMRAALEGTDTLLLVSGEEAVDRLEQHRTAVAAAADAGVRRVVYTSFLGAAPDATFTLARHHYHTERAIEAAGMSLIALRNSLYQDVLPYFGGDGVIRGPAGEGRFAPVTRADIADVAVACLLDDEHDDRVYDLTGPALLTMADVAATLGRVLGQDVRYEGETLEEAYASRAVYGAPDWQVEAWVSSYTAIAAGELDVVSDDVERVAGHTPSTLEAFLRSR
jgi:uncharacterized protein YbjT (DUF2867 family)